MPARVVEERPLLEVLESDIPRIFDQVQTSAANHQKNCVALYKLSTEAAKLREINDHGKEVPTGERNFAKLLSNMVFRAVPVKKGAAVVDRVVRFVGSYIKFITQKALETVPIGDLYETSEARLVCHFVEHLLPGFEAKDKTVRFRVVQIVSELIPVLQGQDPDFYQDVSSRLSERLLDKEHTVRAQAATAIARLSMHEDDGDPLSSRARVELDELLLEAIACDPAPDVRRAILEHIQVSEATLPAVLQRLRDPDAGNRLMVYSDILSNKVASVATLDLSQREQVVKHGLGDRDPPVRTAAAKVLVGWLDEVEGDLLRFLKFFDLGEEDIPRDSLFSIFESRPDLFREQKFEREYWEDLTPEKAFLARIFSERCVKVQQAALLEDALPVVSLFVAMIQNLYAGLLEDLRAHAMDAHFVSEEEDPGQKEREAVLADKAFVLRELLKLAVNLDYGDEVGRRNMFQLVKNMVSQEALPPQLLTCCLDVLRMMSPNERDLIRVVVEVIHELRDSKDDDDEDADAENGEEEEEMVNGMLFDDPSDDVEQTPTVKRVRERLLKAPKILSPEEQGHRDRLDIRCLELCIATLERVNDTFDKNMTLSGIVQELIFPAVHREEEELKEKGLIAFGLCCLIARDIAISNFRLFADSMRTASDELRESLLKIVIDILMVHQAHYFGNPEHGGARVVEYLAKQLEVEEYPPAQAVICIGLAKMLFSGIIKDEKVLQALVIAYASREMQDNQAVIQCLTYFLQQYTFTSPLRQLRMAKVFIPAFIELSERYRNLDEDEDIRVTPGDIGEQLIHCTNPQRVRKSPEQEPDETVHIELAIDIVKTLFDSKFNKEEKRALSGFLGQLYLPPDIDIDKIRTLKLLVINIHTRRPLLDATAKNAFKKFDNAISKKYSAQLENFNEEEWRQLEYLKEYFDFLDGIEPEDTLDDDKESVAPRRSGRKRRSDSVATSVAATTDNGDFDEGTPEPTIKRKAKKPAPKRRRVSEQTESSVGEASTVSGRTPSPVALRRAPRRAAAERGKTPAEAIVISDSNDDDSDSPKVIEISDSDDDDNYVAVPPPVKVKREVIESGKPLRRGGRAKSRSAPPGPPESEPEVDSDDAEVDDLLG